MSDYPVIFSAPMIRALLDGRKMMTRRLAWKEPRDPSTHRIADSYQRPSPWQKVKPGDRLWVRENLEPTQSGFDYAADGEECADLSTMTEEQTEFWDRMALKRDDPINAPTVPCIHMPRWASRLTLVVTATKIEKLQDISEEDARAEGTQVNEIIRDLRVWHASHRAAFCALWMRLHSTDSWDANPELCAISFTVHQVNIDQMKEAA